MEPAFVKEVLARALPPPGANGPLPEGNYHDLYVTAWRALDDACYDALAHDKARNERDGDRYGLLEQIAQVMRRDAREVLIAKVLEAMLRLVGCPESDRDQCTTIEALNAVRVLYGWDLRARSAETRG